VKRSYREKQQLQMKEHECVEKKMPGRTKSDANYPQSKISPTLFEGDEWQQEASIDDEGETFSLGMRLSASLSNRSCENRDDDYPGSSSSFSYSHDGSVCGETNDDSNLNRSLSLTNAMSFTRQLSVPISPPRNKADSCDEFDRPLIRLKYGDRVQVVSMDSRGWVKLARGYGYIRLQNDKQLVKGECICLK